MPIYEFEGVIPVVDPEAFVHPEAVLIGDAIVAPGCFVGPGAVLRADLSRITLMAGCNVQDACIVHSFPGFDVVLEPDAHIGHGAVLHGCRIGRGALIGIHAVVLDEAVVEEGAIVGAMSLVTTGTRIPARTLALGIPARVLRPVSPDQSERKALGTRHYQHLARRCLATMRRVDPLPAIERERPRVPLLGDGRDARV